MLILTVLSILTVAIKPAVAARPPDSGNNKLDEILARLEKIEEKLDEPSTTATFCISQGRGLDLGLKWAAELKATVDAGIGWPNVGWVNAKAQPSWPTVLPFYYVPLPIPTEASLGVAGGRGRNLDICVEIPLTLSPEDQSRLEAIARDMNAAGNTGDGVGEKGKFQRRAGRIINYAAVRVRGNQLPVDSNAFVNVASDDELEFDRVDAAGENLLENGLGEVDEGLDVFRDGNVRDLLASLELPSEVRTFMDDPERIFEGLPDLAGGFEALTCDQLGISAGMRSRRPRLDNVCERIDELPDFDTVRDAFERIDGLTDETVDAIAELMAPLLSDVGETRENTKERFCNSRIGMRPAFDRYCCDVDPSRCR